MSTAVTPIDIDEVPRYLPTPMQILAAAGRIRAVGFIGERGAHPPWTPADYILRARCQVTDRVMRASTPRVVQWEDSWRVVWSSFDRERRSVCFRTRTVAELYCQELIASGSR